VDQKTTAARREVPKRKKKRQIRNAWAQNGQQRMQGVGKSNAMVQAENAD
jgi:hypothetical protein